MQTLPPARIESVEAAGDQAEAAVGISMEREQRVRAVVALALIAAVLAPACMGRAPAGQRPVPLCALLRETATHEGRWVTTRGTLTSGPEAAFLSSRSCPNPESRVFVDPFAVWKGRPGVKRRLTKLLRSGRAEVLVTGRFHGPKQVRSPGVSPGFDDLHRQAHSRWGHNSAFRYALVDPEFLSAEPAE